MRKTIKTHKKVIVLAILLIAINTVVAQTGGPGPSVPTPPAVGAPIDGISGLIMMGLAAIFGKKFIDKK